MTTGTEQKILEIKNIEKSYPVPHLNPFKKAETFKALDCINLIIPAKAVTCILGPNGAGKTTLIKILSGLILPDKGEIISPNKEKKGVGLVTPNDRSFYWRLTGRQNLEFFATLYNIPEKSQRISEVLAETRLQGDADKPFRQYSAGMKQKLNIARALISKPALYLLDEPATHLDPLAREEFRNFIKDILIEKEGASVILCTHDMDEAGRLADYIALLHKGRILAEGQPDFLKKMVQSESSYSLKYCQCPSDWLQNHNSIALENREGQLILKTEEEGLTPLMESFIRSGGTIKEIRKNEPQLMDILKHYIGEHNE